MAVPSYTTDLVDIDLCEVGGKTWAEPTAVGWTQGAGPGDDDDNPFQGVGSKSKAFNAVGVGGMMVNHGGAISLPTDGAILGWFYWAAPGSLEADVDGGIRMMAGSDLANFLSWDLGGKTSYVYGGWINYAYNTGVTPDDTVGTGLGNSQYVGAAVNNFNSIFKGNPFVSDAYRYGRAEARINGGEGPANYATFTGFAATNDASANRWGLIQTIDGGFLWKGLLTLGYASAVDFRDSNKMILVQNTMKVTANFNKIEIRQPTSRVDLTNISFLARGTISRGDLLVADDADINIDTCVFTDMGTFAFAPNSTINDSTFRRTDTITQSGATFDGCIFDSCRGSATIISDNPGAISNVTFISDGSNEAIVIPSKVASAAYTLTNWNYSGYTSAGSGVLGNTCIYNDSGQHIKFTIDGGVEPSYTDGSGATTQIVTGQRILTLTGLVSGSEVRIYDQAGPPPNELAGIEATVTPTETAFQYTYTYSPGTEVDIVVHKNDRIYYRIENYPLADANASLPISQQIDRQYNNP